MSTRQKSFFEQNSKSRPHWQKKKPPHDNGNDGGVSYKPAMAAPPIAPSAETKSKLKAFHFVEGPQKSTACANEGLRQDNSNKENQCVVLGSIGGMTVEGANPPSTDNGPSKIGKDCPQTPLSRLPLADLIGSTEDPMNRARLDVTPDERVYWNHSPHSSDQLSSSATPALRRGNKRARSSSPSSSSQKEVSSHFVNNKDVDQDSTQRILKTPQADPATDLWNRYAVGADNLPAHNGQPLPAFAHLIESPSSHLANALLEKDGSGLRRSLSGGFEFGKPKAKRRRINSVLRGEKDDDIFRIPTEDANNKRTDPRMSRVSSLVEKIQENFLKTRSVMGRPAPSSSSPFPEGADKMVPPLSPPRKESLADIRGPHCHMREIAMIDASDCDTARGVAAHPRRGGDTSSDYDDDDLDLNLLLRVEEPTETLLITENLRPRSEPVVVDPCMPTGLTEYGAQDQDVLGHQLVDMDGLKPTTTTSLIPDVQHDEFDGFDDDNDVSAADLEDAVARYDTQAVPEHEQAEASGVCSLPQAAPIVVARKDSENISSGGRSGGELEGVSEDEFGDDIDFEQLAVEFTATQDPQRDTQSQYASDKKQKAIKRYLITTVAEGQYETDTGRSHPEKVLLVQDEKANLSKAITLRQSWFDSPCTPGSYIHLIGDFDRYGQCIVDDAQNMIILHPDHLISATVVADSFSCTRRAVLQDRVKATNDANKPQVYGHILHEIFQDAMNANRWDTGWLNETIERIAARYLENLYEIRIPVTEALDYLRSKMPELQVWTDLYVQPHPRPDAHVKDRNGNLALMSINKLLDVEEHVWSPMFGLKGNIDATVQVVMRDERGDRTLTVPLEVKTGRNNSNVSHNAQTALYTLLLSDRYDIDISYGILYYLETSETSRIPAIRQELQHMIMQRNKLACYVRNRLELPPMLKSPHLCGRCYAKTSCFVYHKLVDDGNGETSGLKEKFGEVVQHLKAAHQEFFKKWDDLLTKEEKDILKFRRELWTMLSSEREKLGRCFANVVIEPGSAHEDEDGPKINRFRYTFVRRKGATKSSFTDSQITTGEPIVISDEKGHFALANGYVTNVRKGRITVAVDRRLHNARTRLGDFDERDNQIFAGIMEVFEDGKQRSRLPCPDPDQEVLYRLDKDEFSNGMATVRNNLIRIMEKDLFKARDIRNLVIEGKAPTFKPSSTAYSLSGPASQANLNDDQKRAIDKVMSAKDYALVLGMPGTGKTTTIAHIIRALVAQGKSVLLTSYTHTAVDNILLKIRNDGINILRLGAVAKVHPAVQEFATLAGTPKETMEELRASYEESKVVATTCLGVNHPIFNQRVFDYCIVDEASQITLPVCLGPIRMAKTFILVGDHYQLPPLVQNKEAQEGGLDVSLFKLLSEKHPSSVVNLEHQYRTCEDIMTLSNTLIYNGRLKCGTQAVANRSINVPNISALKHHHRHHHPSLALPSSQTSNPKPPSSTPACGTSCWLHDLLHPSAKARFVNTDPLLPTSLESAHGLRIVNSTEATLCTQLVEALLTTGVAATDIGVITLYRSQLALLRHHLRHRPAVEMHTTDRFQGRDKEVVILSLVRSNGARNVGDLLRDWRRVNVAFTRARTKLLVLGSRETLGGDGLLREFVGLVEGRGWRYDLPSGALEGHVWEEGAGGSATQVSMQSPEASPVARGGKVGLGGSPEARRERRVGGSPVKAGKVGKVPEKTGRIDGRAILKTRPVLRDIVNDAS